MLHTRLISAYRGQAAYVLLIGDCQYGLKGTVSSPRLVHISGDAWTDSPIPTLEGWRFFVVYKMVRVPGANHLYNAG